MLVRCLYASRAVQGLTAETLDAILEQSNRKNPQLGITGLLFVTNGIFVQVLEGGRDAVCDLYNAIVTDGRHCNIRMLAFEEISERRFGNWTMGQVSADSINPAILLKYSEKVELNPFACSGKTTMALLEELLAMGTIVGRGR
jgi:hypothetical protein